MLLTSEQELIVSDECKYQKIIAGAGSGKTFTMIAKLRYLLSKGIKPECILVLMFNKSIQQEFERKLRTEYPSSRIPLVRTYHSTGFRLLNSFFNWGYYNSFHKTPISETQKEFLVMKILDSHIPEELKSKYTEDKAKFVEFAVAFIDRTKSHSLGPEDEFIRSGFSKSYSFVVDVFHAFEQQRKQDNKITFADMIYDSLSLLNEDSDLITKIENKLDYLIVDEFQDTNPLQFQLIKYLAGQRAKVIVVGDDRQSINNFAGSSIELILHGFDKDFGSIVKTHHLSTSFRYGHRIALLSNNLISNNTENSKTPTVSADGNENSHIELIRCMPAQEHQEALKRIKYYIGKQQSVAVLFRRGSQSINIELELLAQGIAYVSELGSSVFDRREVFSVISLLRLASGKLNNLAIPERLKAWNAMLRFPNIGLKNYRVDELASLLSNEATLFGDTIREFVEELPEISDWQKKQVVKRASVIETIEAAELNSSDYVVKNYIELTDLYKKIDELSLTKTSAEESVAGIDSMIVFLAQKGFLPEEAVVYIDELKSGCDRKMTSDAIVTLTTNHKSKGREWPGVIIPGCTDANYPHFRDDELSVNSTIEEERRLFYVAITRAINGLHIFTRNFDAQSEEKPSPFIDELNFRESGIVGSFLSEGKYDELKIWLGQNEISETSKLYLEHLKLL